MSAIKRETQSPVSGKHRVIHVVTTMLSGKKQILPSSHCGTNFQMSSIVFHIDQTMEKRSVVRLVASSSKCGTDIISVHIETSDGLPAPTAKEQTCL